MNLVRRILGEFTGTGSMGAVEVAPVMVNPAPSTQQSRRKVLRHVRRKRKPVSETMTADVAPVLVNPAPELMARLRDRLNKEEPKKKSAIESILGEAEAGEDLSLIPDDADKLLTTKEVEDEKKTVDTSINLGKEDLLQTALALVAPDTTPSSAHELDPSLVPNRDPALSTILGEKPRTGPTAVKTESVSPKKPEVETKLEESASLPSLEMPRPPGEFLRSIGDITGEGREEKPKVELVMGNSSSPVGSAVSEGMLGASEMPTPKEANIDRTMDAFRRFHRVKI